MVLFRDQLIVASFFWPYGDHHGGFTNKFQDSSYRKGQSLKNKKTTDA